MSTVLAPAPEQAPPATTSGSLLRAELRRFRSRRMVRVMLLLGVLAFLGAVGVASTQYAQPSAAGLARAAELRQAAFDRQQEFQADCLAQATPVGISVEQFCGPPLALDDLGRVEDFIDKQPFDLGRDGRNGLLAVSAATGVLVFLLGATYIGAEWSSRSMVALLFWEPRRRKVMATKLAVTAAAAALIGALATGAWLLAARGLAAARGTSGADWGDLLAGAGRGVLFVVLIGLLGFGIANLLRNTAAAFGFGFVYFAIVENVVRAVRPAWQPYLLTDNAVALLQEGGHRIYLYGELTEIGFSDAPREIVVSNLHGAVLLGAVTALVVAAGVVVFSRRDLD